MAWPGRDEMRDEYFRGMNLETTQTCIATVFFIWKTRADESEVNEFTLLIQKHVKLEKFFDIEFSIIGVY